MGCVTARQRYEAHVGAVLQSVWDRHEKHLGIAPEVDYRTPEVALLEAEAELGCARAHPEDVPADLAHLATADREELLGAVVRLQQERDEARLDTLRALMRYQFGGGPDPVKVAERVFALVRTMLPELCWHMKQWEAGALFGDIRQTWQEKEQKLIEELVSRYASVKFTNAGGKCAAARRKKALQSMGNTSKRHGRRKGDARETGAPDTNAAIPQEKLKEARRMRDEAERRRMAELCGCEPDEIDLDRISLGEE